MENQQLIKKDRSANSYSKIFPWTFTDLVLDRVTKESLDNILVRNNFIALPYVDSKAATRLQVPMKNRRRGIWLSYIDYAGTLTVEYYNDNNLDNNHWQDSSYWLPYNIVEFQPASVGLSALAQEVFDWINSQITTAVKLNPEDLQKNSSGQIEEANRAYDTSTFSGLGYRILRKNIQSNKNVLTQSMINMPNNVYKIRYDFDLNGATINLPANSVLQFVGGSIKNGTLNGNNTAIEADSNAVIFDSVVIEGTWNVEHIYDSWFAFNTSPSYISNQIITNILALSNDDVYNTIHFDADRTYYFELPYKGRANLGDDVRPNYWKLNTSDYDFLRIFTGFTSNTHLIVNNTIQMLPTNQGAYFIFHIENKENITISGTGAINGDAKDHLYTDPFAGTDYYGEWGHIFNFRSCDNIVIRDITVGYAFGDALAFSNIAYNNNGTKAAGPATKNVLIDGVKVLYARRNGIALGGNNYTITNVYFEGCGSDEIKGTAPMAGIDFENDYTEVEPSGVCSNVSMSSCKFKNNKYDVSSTIRDDLGPVPRGQLVTISDCNFTSPLRLNRTNGLTFNNCHIVGISNHDNSISPWFASKDLVFNSCVFDELNPYLAISAEEQNKKFINPTYPEDIKYSTTFQQSLAAGRALKFTIPKPLVGLVEFTAFCSNPNYSAVQMPINITEYSFGNSQRLTGIRDIKVKAAQDNTLRYASYRNVPVFSYINYSEDADNFNIYFAIGGDLISNPLGGNTSVNIFLTSKTKFIVVEAPVSENPGVAGMYGGKWSTLSAITKSVIDVTAIPSSVTFPSKEMFPANMLADLPTSLTSDKVGFSQYVLDNSYKCPVFWDSYSKVFRTADGNRALVRSVTSSDALNTLTDQMTIGDRGYVVYTTVNNSYLTWNGYDWVNEDGSLFTKVKYIKRTVDITTLNNIFSYSNVVYKIVGDIDLAEGTLTIASGSTLDFQGGSFSNGTIVGSSTKLSGNVSLSSIDLSGTYKNNSFSLGWFKTLDANTISNIINRGFDLYIPKGTFIFDSVLRIERSGTKIKGEDKLTSILQFPNSRGIVFNNFIIYRDIEFDNFQIRSKDTAIDFTNNLVTESYPKLFYQSRFTNLWVLSQEGVAIKCTNNRSSAYSTMCFDLLFKDVQVAGINGFEGLASKTIIFDNIGDVSTSWKSGGCDNAILYNSWGVIKNVNASYGEHCLHFLHIPNDNVLTLDTTIHIQDCNFENLQSTFLLSKRSKAGITLILDNVKCQFTTKGTVDFFMIDFEFLNNLYVNNLLFYIGSQATISDPYTDYIHIQNRNNINYSVNSQISYRYGTTNVQASLESISKISQKINKGISTKRPALSDSDEGFQYYDTTLKKMILWNGTTWINFDGSALT